MNRNMNIEHRMGKQWNWVWMYVFSFDGGRSSLIPHAISPDKRKISRDSF